MDMIDNVWKNKGEINIDNAVDITLPVRFSLIFTPLLINLLIYSWPYSLSVPQVCTE